VAVVLSAKLGRTPLESSSLLKAVEQCKQLATELACYCSQVEDENTLLKETQHLYSTQSQPHLSAIDQTPTTKRKMAFDEISAIRPRFQSPWLDFD
jgi:hypothetical protein